MRVRTSRLRAMHGLLTGLFTAGACLAVTAPLTFAGASQWAPSAPRQTGADASGAYQPTEQPAAVSSAHGMMVYIDRRTGALLPGPTRDTVPLQLTPEMQHALSTSAQGLVEVQSSKPGGGVKVDLQGRFQSPLVAITDATGQVTMQHLHAIPGTADQP